MTSRGDAQRLLRQRLAEREDGKVVGRPDRVTFRDVRQGLERHYAREGNRSLRRAQQALNHLERFMGVERRALEITRHLVNGYIEHRLAEGAARSTATYEVRILGAALSVAVEEGLLAIRPTFKLPALRNARTGFFEDGEFAALLLELPTHLRSLIRFLRMTGWRVSEARGLTWDQVDWEGQVMRLHATQTKGGDARVFPFGQAAELKQILEEQQRLRDGLFVFHRRGNPIRSFRMVWARACRKAGLEGRLVHDLRRTAARDFRRQGVSEGEIMRLCGWKTRAMFDRYNIIDEADLAQAVARRFNGKQAANNGTPTAPTSSLSSSPA
ncbi:MAG TPA: tyrosine-type recombinase/integrase [Gemmatimonadales bacterium]|nr:tyrosine-type recombinase/integrase [Gemmatimonadales bacterium]